VVLYSFSLKVWLHRVNAPLTSLLTELYVHSCKISSTTIN